MNKKQKNIILIIGFIVALFICYKFAIRNTFEEMDKYNSLTKEIALSKSAPKQLSLLKQKEKYYDSILDKYKLNGSSIQNNLLRTINAFAKQNKLKVVSFLEPHTILKNDLTIKTYVFTLEGDYEDINKLVYLLEQETKFGEIINFHFQKKKNYRSGKNYLEARVLLKSFG
ncbi:MAG: general secretion pathway protein [Winogradskyella sp.]